MLELIDVTKKVGAETHIDGVSMTLSKGTLNVLLGPTLSGKTSLMRLMAGLDRPTSGDIRLDGRSVVGVAVQQRNVAMVYQQFINYPTLTVYENIASPLRVKRADARTIDAEVRKAAALLRLTDHLTKTPLELSGGQQQRTALARAIVKGAGLVLLDEPLANLDYKLREELRAELPKIFAETGAIFVYATTEPTEALLLGGNTAALSQGRVTQFGPTIDVFNRPVDLLTAETFSDPPLNQLSVEKRGGVSDGAYRIAFRPHHLSLDPEDGAARADAVVAVTEITGSESFVHVDVADGRWVALVHGVRDYQPGDRIPVYVHPDRLFVFDAGGRLAAAPRYAEAA
jgi:glycerol transport system ATP-binding protein